MRSPIKWLLTLYTVIGIMTLIVQIYWRYPVCSGTAGCGLSLAKGVVWSAIWPIYWWIQRVTII
jgi:hypothetical protein